MPIRLARGGRLATPISVEIDPSTAKEARTARATGAPTKPFEKFAGPLPGRVLLAPAELERAAQR
jgi:hypothetical protein